MVDICLIKIGVVLGYKKHEIVFDLSWLLECAPSWLVRKTRLIGGWRRS